MVSTGLADVLRRVPLFQDLASPEIDLLTAHATTRVCEPGSVVFLEGSPCREWLAVAEGSVRLVKLSGGGREQLLSIERAGSSLSDVPVFDDGPHASTAIAATGCLLICLDAGIFRQVCAAHPHLALKVTKALAHRLRRLGGLVEALSFGTVRARLIAHLLHLADERGQSVPGGGTIVERTENNDELAARIGTVRELISRTLGRLHGERLVLMERRRLTIPDRKRLAAELDRAE